MTAGRHLFELTGCAWTTLNHDEREAFDDWLRSARGQDLYLLLRFARTHRRSSSVRDLLATALERDDDDPT